MMRTKERNSGIAKKFRHIVLLVLFCLCLSCSMGMAESPEQPAYLHELEDLEQQYQAVVGVYAIDTETGRTIAYHEDKRFSYCSTHKALLAGAILQHFSLADLNEVIHYSTDDILSYAPVTKNHISEGMTLGSLCEAAIRVSDNTAANLMMQKLGGPKVFKDCLQEIGDKTTRPVRLEPELNTRDGKKDTSTPRQLALDLQAYALGDVLTDEKKPCCSIGCRAMRPATISSAPASLRAGKSRIKAAAGPTARAMTSPSSIRRTESPSYWRF